MSAVGLESIEHTVQLTHAWINDLDTRLGWDNKHRSYRLLRTGSRHSVTGSRSTKRWALGRNFRRSCVASITRLAAGHDACETAKQGRLRRARRRRL